MKEENFNEKENCSAAFKYCDGVFLNSMETAQRQKKQTTKKPSRQPKP